MAKKIKNKPQIFYENMHLDSDAEKWILMYLIELKEKGYIKTIERADSYILSEPVVKSYLELKKTKCNTKQETILEGGSYTPDFKVVLTDLGKKLTLFKDLNTTEKIRDRNKFNFIHQNGVVTIEVKGTSFRTANSTTAEFKYKQKWLYQTHKVFVNLCEPDNVFPKTFTPKLFMITPKKQQVKKISWINKTIEQYLK